MAGGSFVSPPAGRNHTKGRTDEHRRSRSRRKRLHCKSAGTPRSAGAGSSAPTPPKRSCACAAASARPTGSPLRRPTKLWDLLATEDYVQTLGCLTGNQAVECVKAGLQRDLPVGMAGGRRREPRPARPTPTSRCTRPTRSRRCVQRINNALQRADQIAWAEGREADFLAPIVADAEAGFGGPLNAFELMTSMIEAGAAGVHFEDQLQLREEVRAPRRQGPDPDLALPAHADRGAPGRRRAGRADAC